jgi:hypothetical protein
MQIGSTCFAFSSIDENAVIVLWTLGTQMSLFIANETMAKGQLDILGIASFGTGAQGMFGRTTLETEAGVNGVAVFTSTVFGRSFVVVVVAGRTIGDGMSSLTTLITHQVTRLLLASLLGFSVPSQQSVLGAPFFFGQFEFDSTLFVILIWASNLGLLDNCSCRRSCHGGWLRC